MRKRKSPIVLVTALVVIVAGVTGLQFAWSHTSGPESAPPAPEVPDAKPVGDSRPASSAAETSSSIKNAMQASTAPAAHPEAGPDGPPGPSGPMILNPARTGSSKPPKPTPNASSTSTQWYNDATALSKDKG